MIKSTQVIYSLLSNNEAVKSATNGLICPLVIPESSTADCYVIYERVQLKPSYNEDEIIEKKSFVKVSVFHADYDSGLELADLLNEAVELKSGLIAGVDVECIYLHNATEDYLVSTSGVGMYVQVLYYEVL